MQLRDFFARNPVFTHVELQEFLNRRGSSSMWTRKALLAHHRKQGHILQVRRGLYVAVPPGSAPDARSVDPYLLAAKMSSDAVLGYHTALEFHGRAHSIHQRFVYMTERRSSPTTFRTYRFRPVSFPKALRDKGAQAFGVDDAERSGLSVSVTGLERTLVDVLDRSDLSGGWEEIWRSLELVEYFDVAQVAEYARLLGNSTTAAKVGFFLEQHREALMVDDSHLRELRELRPLKPHYMERNRRTSGRLVPQWNLIVPVQVFERSWGEVT